MLYRRLPDLACGRLDDVSTGWCCGRCCASLETPEFRVGHSSPNGIGAGQECCIILLLFCACLSILYTVSWWGILAYSLVRIFRKIFMYLCLLSTFYRNKNMLVIKSKQGSYGDISSGNSFLLKKKKSSCQDWLRDSWWLGKSYFRFCMMALYKRWMHS